MIIPWRLLFEEDRLFYAKDPTHLDNKSLEITPYTSSVGDKAGNYFVGTFFIFCWIISIFLNPILFQYFRTKKAKTTILFKCLAATDFITNLWCPLAYAYCILSPKIFPSSYILLRYTRTWTCMIGCFSQVIGFLLAVYRAVMVTCPNYNIKQIYVRIYLCSYVAVMAIIVGILFVIREYFKGNETARKIMRIAQDFCFWANLVHCSAGVFVSVSTFLYIYYTIRKNPGNNNAKYITSCITILLLNVPYFITVITCVTVRLVAADGINFQEFVYGWIPIVTSAINPVVILTRNSEARRAVPHLLTRAESSGFTKL